MNAKQIKILWSIVVSLALILLLLLCWFVFQDIAPGSKVGYVINHSAQQVSNSRVKIREDWVEKREVPENKPLEGQ